MTIKYLVTGREGVHHCDGCSESSAITKTFGFKKIEDICNEMFDEVDDENRGEMILKNLIANLFASILMERRIGKILITKKPTTKQALGTASI